MTHFLNLRQWLNISYDCNVKGDRGQCLNYLFKKKLWKKIKELITKKWEAVAPAISNVRYWRISRRQTEDK